MLHEIIVALAGHNSKLLDTVNENGDLREFIHPSENEILNKILNIVKIHKYLKDFIDCNIISTLDSVKNECSLEPGLYIQAFCRGLDESLTKYRHKILTLEKNILINPNLNVTYLFSQIDDYTFIFSNIKAMIYCIITKNIRGCQILQLLHENSMEAIDSIKNYYDCIMRKCYVVFLQQTMCWLMNGQLQDPFKEYVIQEELLSNEQITEISLVSKQKNKTTYKINGLYLPIFINYSLMKDIMFVGEIVQILIENPTSFIGSHLIFEDKHMTFFEEFIDLKNDSNVDVSRLEDLVKEIRKCVVEHLWKVAVEEEHLYDALELMKNFYLLGNGEFYKDFLSEVTAFSLPSASYITSQLQAVGLNEVMAEIVSNLHMDENILSTFSFDVKENPSLSDTVWTTIKLQYTPKWPLNLIFTQSALKNYNKLFSFLLRIKRCHIAIHQVWKNEMKNKSWKTSVAWKLRHELMFIINNLLFYLQVDVIETEYNNFIKECHKIRDFKQIEVLHNLFLLNILSHSFLLDIQNDDITGEAVGTAKYSKLFYDVLLGIIVQCEKFCSLFQADIVDHENEVTELEKRFNKYKSRLIICLAEVQARQYKQHVGKLLLRLNFNNWVHDAIINMPSRCN